MPAWLTILLIVAIIASPMLGPAASWIWQRVKSLRLPSVSFNPFGGTMPRWQVYLILLVLWLGMKGPAWEGCELPSIPNLPFVNEKADTVVYTYEKDASEPPNEIKSAINTLKRQGIAASLDEVSSRNGVNQVPAQYAVSRPAAQAAGLPALVVLANGKVLRVVKAPTTEAQVTEAAK